VKFLHGLQVRLMRWKYGLQAEAKDRPIRCCFQRHRLTQRLDGVLQPQRWGSCDVLGDSVLIVSHAKDEPKARKALESLESRAREGADAESHKLADECSTA
jgi:hypothetical protein